MTLIYLIKSETGERLRGDESEMRKMRKRDEKDEKER